MILPDGNIRNVDISDNPSMSYVAVLFQDFYCFERRILKELPQSRGTVKVKGKKIEISAQIPESVEAARIYIAPEDLPIEKINERHLAGIIHRKGKEYFELDPWALYQRCENGIRERYGRKIHNGKGARDSYLRLKLSMIQFPLPFTTDNAPLLLEKDLKGKKVYISSSNWYGEESVLCPL